MGILNERTAPDLWLDLIGRNPDLGGTIALVTGRLGSGKTSLLLEIVRRLLDRRDKLAKTAELGTPEALISNERIFWRGDVACQWRKLPNKYPIEIWVLEGLNLQFYLNGNPHNITFKRFGELKELVERASSNVLNVVYLPSSKDFRNLTKFLVDMSAFAWTTLVMDEVEDVCPSQESGADWRSIRTFTDAVKNARKRRVSLYMATQAISDVDYRLKQKIQYHLLCPGAPRIKGCRVWQRAIDGLQLGECYLASMGNFQLLRFPPYISYDDMVVEGLEKITKPAEYKIGKNNHEVGG